MNRRCCFLFAACAMLGACAPAHTTDRDADAGPPATPGAVVAAPAPGGRVAEPGILEAESLLGQPLYRPALTTERRDRLEQDLAEARARLNSEPDSEKAIIWVGRRLAYLGRFNEALDTFTLGLERHPDSYRLLRHRGHRYLTLRRIDDAIDDLVQASRQVIRVADEIEPDGAPNAAGIPRSTDRFNIYYHLGLGYYLRAEYRKAASHFSAALDTPLVNDDLRVAVNAWVINCYARDWVTGRSWVEHTLKRLPTEFELVENHAYADLIELHRGTLTPQAVMARAEATPGEFATRAYGVSVWLRLNDRNDEALALLEQIIERGNWPAFGHLAAEADLARLADGTEPTDPRAPR